MEPKGRLGNQMIQYMVALKFRVEGARAHHPPLGIREHRLPFRLAPDWYAARYPMAAFEVGQGDYANFAHHYIAVGRERGYRP